LDTTDRGLSATVLPLGTTGRFYTLAVRPTDESSRVEIDATAEGLVVLAAAILDQLDNDHLTALIEDHLAATRHRLATHQAAREASLEGSTEPSCSPEAAR
jgi:hypothetical protein